MTAYPTMDLAISSVTLGVYEFLSKPFKIREFQKGIEGVLVRRQEEKKRVENRFASQLLEVEERRREVYRRMNT